MPRNTQTPSDPAEAKASQVAPTPAQATARLFKALNAHAYGQPENDLLATIQALIQAGADLNAQRPNARGLKTNPWHTPLSLALCSGLEQCAIALIPGSDLSAPLKNSDGCDLVMNAASRPLALAALLAAGADPTRQDDFGRNALMYALRFSTGQPFPYSSEALPPCVGLLLPVSDALAVDHEGFTVVDWAGKGHSGKDLPFILAAIHARAEAQQLLQTVVGPALSGKTSPRL